MGLAFLITSDSLQLLSERKVLKRDEYSAMLDAAGVIEAARDEAARLQAQAEQQAADARTSAYAEGLAQARADHAAAQVSRAQQAQVQLQALRDAMARIVTRAVSQIVADADAARVYESALTRVEALLREESFVAVRVAPAQEDALRRALAALHDRHGWRVKAAIQPDAELADGACVMQTASGTIDLGLQAQIDAFAKALVAATPAGAAR